MSQLFTSDGQSTGTSVSAPVFPMNIQGWFLLGLTDWSPYFPRDFQESSPSPQFKSINSSMLSLLYGSTLTSVHDYWKNHSFVLTFVIKVIYLSRFVIAFLPRRRHLLINFMAAVTSHSDFGPQENKVCHCFHCFPSYLPWSWWDQMPWF